MSKHLSLIAALVATAACNSAHDRTSERDRRGSMPAEGAESTAMTDADLVQHALDVAHDAAARFDAHRVTTVQRMHARLDMIEVEEPMLFALTDIVPLTDTGRTDVDARLDHLATTIQQASLAVDRLDVSSDGEYAADMAFARHAMEFVDTARAQVWRAVGDAKRGETNATGSTGWDGSAGSAAAAAMPPPT
jgi:hypothetical protein